MKKSLMILSITLLAAQAALPSFNHIMKTSIRSAVGTSGALAADAGTAAEGVDRPTIKPAENRGEPVTRR